MTYDFGSSIFDALVSQAWDGADGEELTTLSGCTFHIYKTVQAAIDAGEQEIVVAEGDYVED